MWASKTRYILLAMVLSSAVILMWPEQAFAFNFTSGFLNQLFGGCPGTGVSARIVLCTQKAVMNVADAYFKNVYGVFQGVIFLALTLSIILFGLMMLLGLLDDIKKQTVLMVLKVSFVAYYALNFQTLFVDLMNMMQGLLDLVTPSIPSLTGPAAKCALVGNFMGVWSRMDCLANLVIGIAPGVGLVSGILALVGGLVFTQKVGLIVAGLGLAVILTLIFAIAKAVYTYIAALVAVTFLAMLSPLFVPLAMFSATKSMFDKWVKMILGFMLQPVFLVAYLTLLMTVYDNVVFSGNNSLFRTIAGPAAISPTFQLGTWLAENKLYTNSTRINLFVDAPSPQTKPGEVKDAGAAGNVPQRALDSAGNVIRNLTSMNINLPIQIVDIEKLATMRGTTPQEMISRLTTALMSSALIAYIMFAMLNYIPALGHDMATGVLDGPNLSKGMSSIQSGVTSGFKKMLSNAGGGG